MYAHFKNIKMLRFLMNYSEKQINKEQMCVKRFFFNNFLAFSQYITCTILW